MSDETSAAIARSCAKRWCHAMHVGAAVEELLAARLSDTASVFGAGCLSGALVDREGIRALRMVASSPEIRTEDVHRAREVLEQIR
jgi:hypothetical protein